MASYNFSKIQFPVWEIENFCKIYNSKVHHFYFRWFFELAEQKYIFINQLIKCNGETSLWNNRAEYRILSQEHRSFFYSVECEN